MDMMKLQTLVSDIVAAVLRGGSGRRRCLWILEQMPRNKYVLDHAFQLYSGEYTVDLLPVFTAGSDAREQLAPFGRLLSFADVGAESPPDYQLVGLFNPSLKTLSKLAHLIIDDDLTELIFSFLQNNTEVFIDSWLDRHEYAELPEALKNKIADLLTTVESYGIIQKALTISPAAANLGQNPPNGPILSLEDVKRLLDQGKRPTEMPTARLTPLAIDYLADLQRNRSRKGVEADE